MNKLFTKIAALALGVTMATGVGVAVASNSREASPVEATDETYSLVPNNSNTGNSSTSYVTSAYTFTYSGVSWSINQWNPKTLQIKTNQSNASNEFQFHNTSAFDGRIKSVVVTFDSSSDFTNLASTKLMFKGGTSAVTSTSGGTSGTWNSTNKTTTWTPGNSDNYSYFIFYQNGKAMGGTNKLSTSNSIVVTYEVAQKYTVTYNANNATSGSVPTDSTQYTSGTTVTVKGNTGSLARTGYTFSGWNTKNDGTGTTYAAGSGTFSISGNTTLYAKWTANQYNINYYDQGGSAFSGSHESGYPTKHTYGTATTLKSASKSGYSFDGWFTSSDCSGSAVTSLGATSYTAAISLYAKWTATGNTYSITTTVTNGTYSGDTTIADNGGVASVTISPTGDYKLPGSVSVSGADHTYNSTSGVISLSNATGNVTISAAMVALTEYSITVNETNGSHTGASTIKESRTASLTFEPDSGYGQPASVTVSGATSSWTRGTGVLSLSNPTGNVTVTYVAVGNELTSITISANSGSYTLGDAFVKPTVTAHYSVADDANVTNSPNLEILNYDPYTTGSQSVTIKYTEGGISQTAAYTATVSAKSVGYSYDKISSVSDITEGDYIIAYSTYGFDNRDATSGYTTVTISNDKIAQSAAMDKLAVHIVPVTGGYTLQVSSTSDNNADKYISFTSNSNSLTFVDSSKTMSISAVSSSTHTTHASGGAFAIGDSNTAFSFNGTTGQYRYRFYKTSTTSDATNGKNYYAVDLYKKVSSGTADLIRITASYTGGEKYVGDSISASDFAVKKQLNTGNNLIDVASGYTINVHTLSSTSNTVTVSYTENNITKTFDVVVPATERAVTLESITLVQGQGVVKEYVDWSGAAWDYTGLTVDRTWSDASVEHLSLADLIIAGDATVSPAKPAAGITSFTVSYEYLEVSITNATVSGITVAADYVTSISWTGTHVEHFKAFSGSQLTAAQVGSWSVVPTLAGAGEQSALSFGQYTLKVGNKTIASLPYTWASEDDGQELSITYGKDKDGNDFVKKNGTAVANICATINAIDHDETISGDIEKTATLTKDDAIAIHTASGVGDSAGVEVDHDIDTNIHITGAQGSHVSAVPLFWKDGLRVYAGNTLTISPMNGAVITSISLTSSGATCSAAEGSSPWTISSGGDEDIVITTPTKTTPITSSVVVEYTINGEETTTVHYANQMEHFDAQKKVVEFAKFMNTTMNGTNVCSGTFANLESAWDDVADKYDELFGASTTLSETELAWAKNMLKYATAQWGSDAEPACVEKAMKTYEHCVDKYDLDPFMSSVRSVPGSAKIALIDSVFGSTGTVAIIVVISLVSVTCIGGYFFLKKRKEQ